MGPIIVVGAGVLAVLWFTGWLTPGRLRWVAAATAALVGVRVLAMGQPLVAAGLFAIAGAIGFWKRRPRETMAVDEARGLLGVGPDANAADINAAHRRLITAVHPDKGGSTEASSRANAARDTLLQQLRGSRR